MSAARRNCGYELDARKNITTLLFVNISKYTQIVSKALGAHEVGVLISLLCFLQLNCQVVIENIHQVQTLDNRNKNLQNPKHQVIFMQMSAFRSANTRAYNIVYIIRANQMGLFVLRRPRTALFTQKYGWFCIILYLKSY